MIEEIPRTYQSLTDHYLEDYHKLVYQKYPSFQTNMYVELYSFDLSTSNFDENLKTMYKDVNDEGYGGRFTKIINYPIMNSTNVIYDNTAAERGITTHNSSELNFTVDPTLSVVVKPEDIIKFNISEDYFGFYKVTNVDDSGTFERAYRKVTASLIAGLSEEKINRFVNDYYVFIQEYHKIFTKELARLILTFENDVNYYISELNNSYKNNLDFHIFENGETIITAYERALNNLFHTYKNHIQLEKLKLSNTYKTNFYEEEPTTAIDILINPKYSSTYYKRMKKMKNFNSLRENLQMKSHIYYSSDRSYEDYIYHKYQTSDEYTCSAELITSEYSTEDFWTVFNAFVKGIYNDDPNTMIFCPGQDTTIFNLMKMWIKIYVTEEAFDNKQDETIKYFETYKSTNSLLYKTILLSQILYLNSNCGPYDVLVPNGRFAVDTRIIE